MAEAETDDSKVLRMTLICSLCKDKLHKPRSLPCFHTFCESCLKDYFVKQSAKDKDKVNVTETGIPCPSCELLTLPPKPKLPVEQWAENFPTNRLVGTLIDIVPMQTTCMLCEPCKKNNETKVGRSRCETCRETLCEECARCHLSMKATWNHRVVYLKPTDQNKHSGSDNKPMTITDEGNDAEPAEEVLCQEHRGMVISKFCQDHQQPCCNICIQAEHQSCKNVCDIDEFVKKHKGSQNPRQLLKDIDGLIVDADAVKRERQAIMSDTLARKTKLLKDLGNAKDLLVTHIDRLESQIATQFEDISQTDFAVLQEQVYYCNNTQDVLHQSKAEIETAKEKGLQKTEAITLQIGRKRYSKCAESIKKIRDDSVSPGYLEGEKKQVTEILNMANNLQTGTLVNSGSETTKLPITSSPPETMPHPISMTKQHQRNMTKHAQPGGTGARQSPYLNHQVMKPSQLRVSKQTPEDTTQSSTSIAMPLPAHQLPGNMPLSTGTDHGQHYSKDKKSARKTKTMKVWVKGDKKECRITAMKIWKNKRILMADNGNSKLKIFNEFGEMVSFHSTLSPPWDFAFLNEAKCAVTIPTERKIRMFKIDGVIAEVGFINAPRGCFGITNVGDDMAVTCTSGCVRIIGRNGRVKMTVGTDYIGKRVFSNPEFVAFNPATSHVYVSDHNNHTVTALRYGNGRVDKTPVFIYNMSGPRSVIVDSKGNLYVCGFWSNTVHKVKDTGVLCQILVDTLARPMCIALNTEGDMFALSEQENPNVVKLYRIVPDTDSDED